jgi:hypothetical protein
VNTLEQAFDADRRRVYPTKQQIRQALKLSFPGYPTSYVETSDFRVITGTATIGGSNYALSCDRGKERYLRATMLDTLKEAHVEAMKVAEEKSK